MQRTLSAVVTLTLLAVFSGASNAVANEHSSEASLYRQAVEHPARSDADRARDEQRRPAAVLEFLQIKPGMTVLDLYSGGGYYSELLSRLVGEDGAVVAHTNRAYQGFVGDEPNVRFAGNRLPNVSVLLAENNELELEENAFDAMLMVLTYHDIYYVNAENGWERLDGPQLRAELFKGLRPGGILGIVDHAADAGSPPETGGTTHRIDPALVISELGDAGFVLEAQSDVLRNPDDDRSRSVFDEDLRGKTDRFVMRFRKPR